jgi:hypothetical protein
MKIPSGKILAVSLLITLVPNISAQAEMPTVTVGFINKADVDHKSLKQGLDFAAMILRRTGIELLAVDCSLDASRSVPPCSGFTGPSQISIRLIRRPQQGTDEMGCRKLGFADKLDTTPGNGIVYLFGDVIETVARDRRVPQQDVLGVAITHEIGHLLIAPGHSETGIMRATLEEREWRKASQGLLDFTPQQAEIMRKGVIGRNRLTPAKPYGQDLIQPPLRVLQVEKQVGERYIEPLCFPHGSYFLRMPSA